MKKHTTRATRPAALVVMLALSAVSTACGSNSSSEPKAEPSAPGSGYPVTVQSCGKGYTYNQAPTRAVLGYSGVLRNLRALGVPDAAYGYVLGSYDKLPADYPTSVIEVSPDYTPSRESVLAARPDLFLGNDEGQVTGEGTISEKDLAKAGSNVYILGGYCSGKPAPTSIDVVFDDIVNLGKIFGVTEKADSVVTDLKNRVAASKALGGGRALRVAYVQVYDGKLYALSGYPAFGVIDALGLVNEFADLKQNFAEISKEQALTRKPDALVVIHAGEQTAQEATAEVEKLLAGTPAVRAGRVYAASDSDFQAGGVAIIDHLDAVAKEIFAQS